MAALIDWDESTLINLPVYFIWGHISSHFSELGDLSCARSILLYGLFE